jgi:RNA polymerase sigma-70 factor (ECF subfamily)
MLLSGDRELRDAFRQGLPAALERVYLAYAPEVGACLTQMFPVRARASEPGLAPMDLDSVLQETFLRAFKSENRLAYDGVRPYRSFLLSMARATAIDWMRAQGKLARESVPLDSAPEVQALSMEDRSPEEKALDHELRTLVADFLSQCPEEDRKLAELRFMEGQSQEAAAEKLGLSRGEVRWREKRVKRAFTEHVIRRGWLEEDRPGRSGTSAAMLMMLLMRLG